MAIVFSCPCGRKLQVAEELAGKPVRCPACFQVTNAAEKTPEPEPPIAQLAPEEPPPERAGLVARPRHGAPARAEANPAARVSKLSVAGLVVSGAALYLGDLLGSFSIAILGGLLGAVISLIAWVRVRASGGKLRGSGLATTGAVVGIGGAVSGLLLIAIAIAFLIAVIYLAAQFFQMFPSGPTTCR